MFLRSGCDAGEGANVGVSSEPLGVSRSDAASYILGGVAAVLSGPQLPNGEFDLQWTCASTPAAANLQTGRGTGCADLCLRRRQHARAAAAGDGRRCSAV